MVLKLAGCANFRKVWGQALNFPKILRKTNAFRTIILGKLRAWPQTFLKFAHKRPGEFVSSVLLYLFGMLLIGLWWILAFKQPVETFQESISRSHVKESAKTSILKLLSPLKRDILHEALSGDFSLMTKLIAEWDIDAQFLEGQGVNQVQRLPRSSYIHAMLLGRQLKKSAPHELYALRKAKRKSEILDDSGKVFLLDDSYQRYLPQTYVAATFMLALTSPDQIVAIPRGLREQTLLFPKAVTDQIPLDIDRFTAEKLYNTHAGIAFVAPYSHPNTLQALQEQGIKLFTLNEIRTLPDIKESLSRIGHVINRSIEADLLNIFIEASLIAIDNRVLALNLQFEGETYKPRVLFLNYHSKYSIPATNSLTSHLLNRIGIQTLASTSSHMALPVQQEQIVNYDPDCLIVSTLAYQSSLHEFLSGDPAFQNLRAVRKGHAYFVDEIIQQSPTQYVVLAYYDLFNALASAYIP